jgi:carboxypeptidase Taq
VGALIAACEADAEVMAGGYAAANLRNLRRDFDRATRLPMDLVRETAEVGTLAMHRWREAREAVTFPRSRPGWSGWSGSTVTRPNARGVPEGGEVYDALLENLEPGMRAADLDRVFGELRTGLVSLIRGLRETGTATTTISS